MPLYEFHCNKCETEFEELVLSSKPEALTTVACPECGSRKVTKKVSTFASGVSGGSSATATRASSSCAPSGGG
jgi:putative FmdB family regulatory protein